MNAPKYNYIGPVDWSSVRFLDLPEPQEHRRELTPEQRGPCPVCGRKRVAEKDKPPCTGA